MPSITHPSSVAGTAKELNTLLDKNLAKRLAKAHEVLNAVKPLPGYTQDQDDQSLKSLQLIIVQIEECTLDYKKSLAFFQQLAYQRQIQYTEGPASVKEIGLALWVNFSRDYHSRTLAYQVVNMIWLRLLKQQAFGVPTNIFGPNSAKALNDYHQSYKSLFESFQLLPKVSRAVGFQPVETKLQEGLH